MAFSHAHVFRIDTFNAEFRESHSHIYRRESSAHGFNPIQILRDARAVEATDTSRMAAYAPRCKLGSGTKVIQDIFSWINADGVDRKGGMRCPMLWFQGPAGGKTCIMREVVSRCEEMGLLTASYFFSTKVAGLDNDGPPGPVATIAYQLYTQSHVLEDLDLDQKDNYRRRRT